MNPPEKELPVGKNIVNRSELRVARAKPVDSGADAEYGKPVIRKMKRQYLLVWLVPIAAAIVATLYFREYCDKQGATVRVEFSAADDIHVGDTPVMHRGVKIGQVSGVELTKDLHHALVNVRLEREYEVFARAGANYWIVRPEISTTSGLSGLNTVFTGPYLEAMPGKGEKVKQIYGIEQAPEAPVDGMSLHLTSPKVEHFSSGSPIYYRGVQVGAVRNITLGNVSDHVDIHIEIWPRYERLVTTATHFWMMSGIDVSGGIFTGLRLKLESLPILVNGAIAFATPDAKDVQEPSAKVKPGTTFALEPEAKKEWLAWSPKIPLGAASARR